MRTINLLPPEQAAKDKKRRGTFGLIFFMLVWLVVLVGLFFWLSGQLSDAEDRVAAQRAVNAQLQADIASLSEAREVKGSYDQAVAQITSVLLVDINWGSFLNDVGRVIPDDVWLTSMSASRSVPDFTLEPPYTYGGVSMAGNAFTYPDASTWIRTLDSAEWDSVGGAWVSSVRLATVNDVSVVGFSSSASIFDSSLSRRSIDRIPVVEE